MSAAASATLGKCGMGNSLTVARTQILTLRSATIADARAGRFDRRRNIRRRLGATI
jgi:hypothetical protein